MAIQFARVDIISRSSGGSAVGISSYISRSQREAHITGRDYYFTHQKDDLAFHGILLPKNAPEWASDGELLWNAAEMAEKRKDSQLAKHMVLALPKELSEAEREELTCRFVTKYFTDRGVAVEVSIHKPHKGEENWHAHLLISTRYLEAEGFTRKAIELNPSFAKGRSGKGFVREQDEWGDKWAVFQNEFFHEKGLDLTVDSISLQPGLHLKGSRFIDDAEKVRENVARFQQAQEIIVMTPEAVLPALTYHRSYFAERDVARYLFKAGLENEAFEEAKASILNASVALYDRESGEHSGYYTTHAVRQSENTIMACAKALHASNNHHVKPSVADHIKASYTLTEEQMGAFEAALGGSDLVLWRGVAGAGKSYVMGAVRDAYSASSYQVIGLAPTNTVTRDMEGGGFQEARTLHSFLGRVERGTQTLTSNHILIVDEAAMVSTRVLEKFMRHAQENGAKVLLIGDDRQLSSVERGGMFSILREQFGAYELREIRRQHHDWAKEASLNFADRNFKEGLKAYDERGYIHWSESLIDAKKELANHWRQSVEHDSEKVRFVYAQTNNDVNTLNTLLRDIRKEKEEFKQEYEFSTVRGRIMVAEKDRLQFYENDYKQKLFNGYCGTVERIQEHLLWVKLDNGRKVSIDTNHYQGFGFGYAGTVYRGQGKTQVETYYLHTPLSESKTSYVALTRHEQACHIFASYETTRDLDQLARQMGRYVERGSSLIYATYDEIPFKEDISLSLEERNNNDKSRLKTLWDTFKEWRAENHSINIENLSLNQSISAIEKLNEQMYRQAWDKALESGLVKRALEMLEKPSPAIQRSSFDILKEANKKLQEIEKNYAFHQRKGSILPNEEKALHEQQQVYKCAFLKCAKEQPELAGKEACKILEKYGNSWGLEDSEKERFDIAKSALKESISMMKETHQWEQFKRENPQHAKQWQETLKLTYERERGLELSL